MRRIIRPGIRTEWEPIEPGEIVCISCNTEKGDSYYIAHKIEGYNTCYKCSLSTTNNGASCPIPYDENGWRLCVHNSVLFKPVDQILEDL